MVKVDHKLTSEGLWNTESNFKLDVTEDLNDKIFTCQVEPSKQLEGDNIVKKKTIKIKVICKFIVTLTFNFFSWNNEIMLKNLFITSLDKI